MEINYIHEYLTLLDVGDYLDAADQLYISPSSLVRHMKRLEQELGTPLFSSTGRTVMPSAAAAAFIPLARELVQTQEKCFSAIRKVTESANPSLVLGIVSLESQAYDLQSFIEDYKRRNPSANFTIVEGETLQLNEQLLNGSVDLVMSYMPPAASSQNTKGFIILKDHLALLASASNPLAVGDSVPFSHLKELMLLLRPRGYLNDLINDALRENGIDGQFESYIPPSTASIFSMVATDLSLSIMPKIAAEYLIERMGKDTIRVLDLLPHKEAPIYLTYLDQVSEDPLRKDFLEFMREHEE